MEPRPPAGLAAVVVILIWGPGGHSLRPGRAADGPRPVGRVLLDPGRGRAGDREPAARRRALHRRAPGRDDLAPVLLARRRRLHRLARPGARGGRRSPGLLRRPRALPDPPRRRAEDARARGRGAEDDLDAGAALRSLRPRRAA